MPTGAKTDHLTDGSTSGEVCWKDADVDAGDGEGVKVEEEGAEEAGEVEESFMFCCTCYHKQQRQR